MHAVDERVDVMARLDGMRLYGWRKGKRIMLIAGVEMIGDSDTV